MMQFSTWWDNAELEDKEEMVYRYLCDVDPHKTVYHSTVDSMEFLYLNWDYIQRRTRLVLGRYIEQKIKEQNAKRKNERPKPVAQTNESSGVDKGLFAVH